MQIEVAEKEALGIYAQRYLGRSSHMKRLYLPLLIATIAFVVSLFLMPYIGDWLGFLLFFILVSPIIYISWRRLYNSNKYARSQIKEQG